MSEKKMITIDGVEHELDALPEAAKVQISNLQAVETEMNRQRALLTMLQAARMKYMELLKAELPTNVTAEKVASSTSKIAENEKEDKPAAKPAAKKATATKKPVAKKASA